MTASIDVAIVGAGPAGLSAALVLGRARRRVVIVDDGRPRNARSHAVRGFLSREGVRPAELLRLGRAELTQYDSVRLLDDRVEQAARVANGFRLRTRGKLELHARKVILATGVEDDLPDVPGLEPLYGTSVFHCPFCDGWEHRDRRLAVYGRDGEQAATYALELLMWSRDVTLCLDGGALPDALAERLRRHGVVVRPELIERLEGEEGRLRSVVFRAAPSLLRDALFFYSGRVQRSDLQAQLGCAEFDPHGRDALRFGRTDVAGLYIVGDASRDVQQVSVAVAEGAEAAIALVSELVAEDFP